MLWRPHRNYLQTTLNCHKTNVNFNIMVALLFVSIMMLKQHTVGLSVSFFHSGSLLPWVLNGPEADRRIIIDFELL